MDHLKWQDLKHGENNLWYEYNDSDTVVVFVHGFFSESKGTWLYENKVDPSKNVFWPDLIRQDKRLKNPSQFLGGYHTALDSGTYGFEKCADELFRALQRGDEFWHSPVMVKQRIVFVCHSMGGIIARYLLERNREEFLEKQVGIVLIASPSYGSGLANRLAWLAELYNQKQALHLKWGDALLKDLDSRFKDLINDRAITNLSGVEACENHFILHRKFLPDKNIVVTEESAGRYFGAPKMLPGTDHFSAVKPNGMRHAAHELLVDFWQTYANTKILTHMIEVDPLSKVEAKLQSPKPLASPSSSMGAISTGENQVSVFVQRKSERTNNIPYQLDTFCGREQDVHETKKLLASKRMVTLTGTGGVGKTRLALQIAIEMAEEYADGIYLVDLTSLTDPKLLVGEVTSVLKVRPVIGTELIQSLTEHLSSKNALLILDNCEHLRKECAQLSQDLLKKSPNICILATSREWLQIGHNFPVSPLAKPDYRNLPPFEERFEYASFKLFRDRALAADPFFLVNTSNWYDIALLCHRLDGLPLAIELAARLVKSRSIGQILELIDSSLSLLRDDSGTSKSGHETINAVINSSFACLLPPEKEVFCRLSVFAGGWTLEAIVAVNNLNIVMPANMSDILASLSDKNLIVVENIGNEKRYRFLETIRQFSEERLRLSPDFEQIQKLHLKWYLSFAEKLAQQLIGANQVKWLNLFEREYDNMRRALSYCKNILSLCL